MHGGSPGRGDLGLGCSPGQGPVAGRRFSFHFESGHFLSTWLLSLLITALPGEETGPERLRRLTKATQLANGRGRFTPTPTPGLVWEGCSQGAEGFGAGCQEGHLGASKVSEQNDPVFWGRGERSCQTEKTLLPSFTRLECASLGPVPGTTPWAECCLGTPVGQEGGKLRCGQKAQRAPGRVRVQGYRSREHLLSRRPRLHLRPCRPHTGRVFQRDEAGPAFSRVWVMGRAGGLSDQCTPG